MKRIHLILSPLDKTQLTFINDNPQRNDVVVCLDHVELDTTIRNRCKFISEFKINSKVKSNEFYADILQIQSKEVRDIILAYSDILCAHLLDKLFKVLLFIEGQLDSDCIYIYSAKSYGDSIPISGYKTIELRRGSDLLLGAFVAQKIKSAYPNNVFIFKYRKPDFFCVSIFRKTIIKSLDFIFMLMFMFKIFALQRKLKIKNKIIDNKVLAVARVPHQIRYSKELAIESKNEVFNLMIIPQARQGRISDLVKIINELPKNVNVLLPSIDRLAINVIKVILDSFLRNPLKDKYTDEVIHVKFDKSELTFNTQDIVCEPLCLLTDILYKNYLNEYMSINRYKIRRLISFSLKGRYAKFEKLASENSGIAMYTIQTAALDDFPSAVFPLADVFFPDSLTSLKAVASNGHISGGAIEYAGCPYRIEPIRVVKEAQNITYFTQPYEYEETLSLLFNLLDWCRKRNVVLTLKLHPRDNKASYQKLVDEFPNNIFFDNSPHSEDAIKASDLCIARTSSVIIEALASGVPVVVCLLSSFDRSFKISFLDLVKDINFYIENEKELLDFLSSLDVLYDKSQELQNSLYSNKDIKNLSDRVLSV